MSYTRLLVGNVAGTILAELQPEIAHLSWRLNNVGQCSFKIAANDPKAVQSNLNFGNRILVEFENGLPSWGGVIGTPRTWDNGLIQVDAYSGEKLFEQRITAKTKTFSGVPVGSIYEELINEANGVSATGVVIGNIWPGGSGHSPDYHLKYLLDVFQKNLTERLSINDFDVVPFIEAGKIKFKANFYDARGSTKTGIALVEDKNLGPIKLKEQGPIINSWTVAGEGSDWGASRLTSTQQDTESIGDYGLREGSRVYGDVADQGSLDSQAQTSLDKTKNPFNIYTLTALDKKPARFVDYDYGDTIRLIAPNYGFGGTDTMVRIRSREFDPAAGSCSLVVQEVL